MTTTGHIGLGYIRKSLVWKRADETSVERQEHNVQTAIRRDGLTPEIHADAEGHRSGRNDKYRPEWRTIMQRIADPDVKSLYVDALSRAWRSTKGWNELLELCKRHQVNIVLLQEGMNTGSKFGAIQKSLSDMIASMAELESGLASERMRDNVTYLKSRGVYWGQTPFGLVRAGEGLDACLKPNPPHDETVRAVLRIWGSGKSYAQTAGELNRQGLRFFNRNRQPVLFTNEAVRTIVNNTLTYAGYVIDHGGPAKERQFRLEGEGPVVEQCARGMRAIRGQVEPIIDADLAGLSIQRALNKRPSGRRADGWTALLTPLLYHQGAKLWAQARADAHCYRHRGTSGLSFDADALDADVLERLHQVKLPADIRDTIRADLARKLGTSERSKWADQVNRLQRRLSNLTQMRADGEIVPDEYRTMRTETERALTDARTKANAPDSGADLMQQLTTLGAVLDHLAPAQRKHVLQGVVHRIDVDDAGHVAGMAWRAEWNASAFRELDLIQSRDTPAPDRKL